MYFNESQGKQHGRCEVRWRNPKLDRQRASLDAREKNLIGQWPESNSSVGETTAPHLKDWRLLVREKQPTKDYHGSNSIRIALCASKQRVHSAKFGALAPVLKKSATELKPKPNLLGCKTINVVKFNVRTLNTINPC